MTRILRIINRFNLGGPTYNATFLSAFLSDEYETKLIGGAHEEHEGDSLFIPEKYGVDFEIIPELQRSVSFSADRKAIQKVRKIIREFKPDIVHTHASKAGAVGRIAAAKEGVPVIVHTFHGHVFHSYFNPLKTAFFKQVERRLAKKSSAIIAISPQQKHELVDIHKIAPEHKVHVVPLGFDLEPYTAHKADKRLGFRRNWEVQDEVVIGIIGRLTAIKNHKLFIDAFLQVLRSTDVPVKAFVIGDGEMRDELEGYVANSCKTEERNAFVFTSWMKNIEEILPGLDIVALSSLNEGTPVSLIEAQAAGVPVISTNVGGVRDVILNQQTGVIVDSFETVEFANALLDLVNDKKKRQLMSQNGWNHVQKKYHYTRLCNEMEELYRELGQKTKG